MRTFMSWIKTLILNFVVFICLLAVIEFSFRLASSVKNCLRGQCNFYYLTQLHTTDKKYVILENIGLTMQDDLAGFIHTPNFSRNIELEGWGNSNVTINQFGLRVNGNGKDKIQLQNYGVIAAGDSFVFGSQVGNSKTWPSCLERKIKSAVANAGVGDYGTAQALVRLESLIESISPEVIILSTTVGHDLTRDTDRVRYGFPKPSFQMVDDKIVQNSPTLNELGTRYNPNKAAKILGYSALYRFLHSRLENFLIDPTGMRLHEKVGSPPEDEELIRYIFDRFSKLDTSKKLFVLQYSSHFSLERIAAERMIWKKISLEFPNVMTLDTFETVMSKPMVDIWNGHHTPLGNELVCNHIYNKGFKSG